MTDEKIQNLRNNPEEGACYFAKKLAFTLGPVELKELQEKGNIKILDVRRQADYEVGHLPQALSIPYDELESRLNELNREELHVVYCYNHYCHLASRAALLLSKNDYSVMELSGGFKTWAEEFHFAVVQD